jgi:hypothetical protein
MSEADLKKALLKKDPHTSADDELKLLRDLLEAEQRRVSRLGLGSLAAWCGWAGCALLMLLLPVWMARPATPPGQPPLPIEPPSALFSLFTTVLGLGLLTGFFVLPIAGLVLLVLYIVANRSPLSRSWLATKGPLK